MESADEGSVTWMISDLKQGQPEVVQRLWDRYFEQLVRLARSKLSAARRPGSLIDEEDAALSAFASFCRRAEAGSFPRLDDRDDLWNLLVNITLRKAYDQIERSKAKRRGWGRIIGQSHLQEVSGHSWIEQVIGKEPSAEIAASLAEEYQRRLDALGQEDLRTIAIARMEEYSNEEISHKLGCSVRLVCYKLKMIRKIWSELPT